MNMTWKDFIDLAVNGGLNTIDIPNDEDWCIDIYASLDEEFLERITLG